MLQKYLKMRTRKSGFTLAETLITLVIVGIVAALTIPSLINKHNEQETTAKVKKTFATLSNAMTFVKAAGGTSDFKVVNGSDVFMKDWFNTYMKPYLSTQKVCYNTIGCWNTTGTRYLNGGLYYAKNLGSNTLTAILNDGTRISIDAWDNMSTVRNTFGINANETTLVIFFDINGEKKPNQLGKDVFLTVYKNGGLLVPGYYDRTIEEVKSNCSKTGTGFSCLRLYLQNETKA